MTYSKGKNDVVIESKSVGESETHSRMMSSLYLFHCARCAMGRGPSRRAISTLLEALIMMRGFCNP
jgi:hypothetical protein